MGRSSLICLAVLSILVSGCSSSSAPSSNAPDEPEAPPSVGKEAPYKGGFTKEMRTADAQTIISLFERNYAPREWKQESLGISFEKNSRAFVETATKDMDDESFYGLIAQYLSGFHDSHIGFDFPSSARAALPIATDYIEGKVIVIDVDESVADEVGIGSEIVSVDGIPAEEILANNLKYIGEGNPNTALRFAASRIAFIPQSRFPIMPDKTMSTIVLKAPGSDSTSEVVMEWHLEGNEFAIFNDPGIDLTVGTKSQTIEEKMNPLRNRTNRMFSRSKDYAHVSMGDVEPFFPTGENFILRKAEPYYVGVFLVEGRRIGYIRIHDFHGGTYEFKDAISQLMEDIPYLEETTDALILDETGNPGGSWKYSTIVASFFFDRPFEDLKERWKANRAVLSWAENAASSTQDFESSEWFKMLITEVTSAMKEGRLLTSPLPLVNTTGMIEPFVTDEGTQISYTKPILLLMNELSVSCGDLFPALMRDNNRATLFGARTMGGGGAVNWTSQLGYAEVSIGHTISMVERNATTEFEGKETNLIENVGVTPDIEYQITLDDFMGGYETYRDSAIQAVLSLIDNAVEDDEEGKEGGE